MNSRGITTKKHAPSPPSKIRDLNFFNRRRKNSFASLGDALQALGINTSHDLTAIIWKILAGFYPNSFLNIIIPNGKELQIIATFNEIFSSAEI